MPRTSIIVLAYLRADFVTRRIAELEQLYAQDKDIEFLLFDNGCPDNSISDAWQAGVGVLGDTIATRGRWDAKMARADRNWGFGVGFNLAVVLTKGKFIHLLSDDCQVRGDFVAPVEGLLKKPPEKVVGHQLIGHKAGWNTFGEHPPIPYLAGHYLAMRRSTWNNLGGFDPQYSPHDYEDIDLSMMATELGIPLCPMRDLPIYHMVAATIGYTPARMEHTVKMREKFAQKWGLPNEPRRP